jgi:hypothetical protein
VRLTFSYFEERLDTGSPPNRQPTFLGLGPNSGPMPVSYLLLISAISRTSLSGISPLINSLIMRFLFLFSPVSLLLLYFPTTLTVLVCGGGWEARFCGSRRGTGENRPSLFVYVFARDEYPNE